MEFALSPEQQLLRESLARFTADSCGLDQRRRSMAEPQGFSPVVWRGFMELGVGRMPFAETRGGLGFGGAELMIVGEAFGRALAVEPYLSSIVLAGTAIAAAEETASAQQVLDQVMDGEMLAALALDAKVTATSAGDGWRLDGVARGVIGGDAAGLFVLPAGEDLYLLPASTAGLSRRTYRLHGGGGAADLALTGAQVSASMRLRRGEATARAIEAGLCFIAAEAAGAMSGALDVTVEHLQTRVQFGAPLGANQALQHRAAEMLVEVEQARSAAIYAAVLLGEEDARERARGFAAVKAVIGKAGRFVAQSAVQLHGGLGVSEEHVVSHYFRRLTALGLLLGDTDAHVAKLAALGGFTGTADHLAG